jgi:hypothetical protein
MPDQGDAFRPANAGQSVPERLNLEWFNGVNRAVNTLRGGNVDLANNQLSRIGGTSWITVDLVNKCGSDVGVGGVLKLDGLNFSFDDKPLQVYDRPLMQGTTPAGGDDEFVILTAPLRANQPGVGVKVGLVFCQLYYADVTGSQNRATPTSITTYLIGGTTGAPILWRELEDESGADTIGVQWALVSLGGGNSSPSSDYRMIRGMSYGVQSGSTILIDNIRPLANSKDPSEGDSSVRIEVYNLFGNSFTDNELVDAVYQPNVADGDPVWETLKSTGLEKNRLIQGRVTSTVTAADPEFLVDIIVPLANGNDPAAGDPSVTVEVNNANGDTFEEDQQIDIVWFDIGISSGWTTLLTERFRAIQGIVYNIADGGLLRIKGIQPMMSGRDPRTNLEDADELVDVIDYLHQTWHEGDIIYAMWNAGTLTWEAMPGGGGGGGSAVGYGYTTSGTIGAGSSGTGSITGYFTDGTSEDLGSHTLINTCSYPINGSGGCTRVNTVRPPDMLFHPAEFGEHDEDVYLVMGGGVTCGTQDVATGITCVDGANVPDITTISYLACPEDE